MRLRDVPIRFKLLIAVSIPAFALLASSFILLQTQHHQVEAERSVAHSYEVRSRLDQALTLLGDAESAAARLPEVARSLEELTSGNPVQQARAKALKNAAAQRLRSLKALAPEAGTASTDAVRRIVAAMEREEARLLERRSERARDSRRRISWWIGITALLGVGGALLAVGAFARSEASRLGILVENAERLARGAPLISTELSSDEIGRVGTQLVRSAGQLVEREADLQRTRRFLERLIETSPTVIFEQDPRSFVIAYVSPNVLAILGYEPGEIVGVPGFWEERIHPDDRARVLGEDRAAVEARQTHLDIEYRFRRHDGEYRWLQSFVRIEYDAAGHAVAMLGHRLDITERKRYAGLLLEREASVDAANRELEAFSYSVSHDLRAPLRAIDGFTGALQEEYSSSLDETGRGYLDRVRVGVQRMAQLTEDLLNLARLSRRPLQRGPVDLSAMARGVIEDLRRQEPGRAAEVRITGGLMADADEGLARIVLQNLLGNAWKFTGKRATAEIEFGVREGNFFIRDNGAGFDPAYAGKLFGPFQRLHAAREFSGTGIGLATVYRIVRRHGGTVSGEGVPDGGATFSFTLGA